MQKASLGEVELEYELHGDGEPVLLLHPGIFSDWFEPLLHERGLTTRYRIVHYHRLGCAGSSRLARPVSFGEQAAHARALLQYLGIARAHVVGHSSSANIALQLALDAPDMVQSLALLEPALMSVPSAAVSRKFVGEAVGRYRAGDRVGAIDIFYAVPVVPNIVRYWTEPFQPGSISPCRTRRRFSSRRCPRSSNGRFGRRTPGG